MQTLITPIGINECLIAAQNGEIICNSTQICINTNGSFVCMCPEGTVLYEGKCIEPQSFVSTISTTIDSTPSAVVLNNRVRVTIVETLKSVNYFSIKS